MRSAFGDVGTAALDPKKAYAARMQEVMFIRGMNLYVAVLVPECWEPTRKFPIRTGCVDVNKGDEMNPTYKSRNAVR